MPLAIYLSKTCEALGAKFICCDVPLRYFDTLKDIGNHGGKKTLFLQHGPAAVADLQASLRSNLMSEMVKPSSMKRG